MELFPHQQTMVSDIHDAIRSGKTRIIAKLPTGGGKTVIAAHIAKLALQKKKKVAFLVDKIQLANQAYETFSKQFGLYAGVTQASNPFFDPEAPLQIASCQTLERRKGALKDIDLFIVDEAHCLRKTHIDIISNFLTPVIGFTATPFRVGLGNLYDGLISGPSAQELTDKGYLVPARYFAPYTPDMSGAKVRMGDYSEKDIMEIVGKPGIVDDLVNFWMIHGENRPTIVMATNVLHSEYIRARFRLEHITAEHIEAKTPPEERARIIDGFKDGTVKVLTSVGVLTTGFDAPNAGCVILARPTKSHMLHLQQIGRGLRTCPGKKDCLIFDHAGNTLRHGFHTEDHLDELIMDKDVLKQEERERKERLPFACPQCQAVNSIKDLVCTECGWKRPTGGKNIDVKEGSLAEIDARLVINDPKMIDEALEISRELRLAFYMREAATRNYKAGWAAFKFKEYYGYWPGDGTKSKALGLASTLKDSATADQQFHLTNEVQTIIAKAKREFRKNKIRSTYAHVKKGRKRNWDVRRGY